MNDPLEHLLNGGRLRGTGYGPECPQFYIVGKLLPNGKVRLTEWRVGKSYRYASFFDRSPEVMREYLANFDPQPVRPLATSTPV